MTNKQRLQKLRTECTDWEQIVRKFELLGGIAPRDVELAILALIDAGLVRIERSAALIPHQRHPCRSRPKFAPFGRMGDHHRPF
jgi:hypothetical protein